MVSLGAMRLYFFSLFCYLCHFESARLIFDIFLLLVYLTVCFLATFDILSRSLAHISAISLSSKRVEMVKRLFWTKSDKY